MGEFSENHYQRVPGEENTAADKNLPDNRTSAIHAHPKPPAAGVQAASPPEHPVLSTRGRGEGFTQKVTGMH